MDVFCETNYINKMSCPESKDYLCKNIKDWQGEDCMQWAADVELQLNIPLSQWLSIDGFQRLTGRDLLRYKEKDFCQKIDFNYGPMFYKQFRVLKKKMEKGSQKINKPSFIMDEPPVLGGGPNWNIPENQYFQTMESTECSSLEELEPSINYLQNDFWSNDSSFHNIQCNDSLMPEDLYSPLSIDTVVSDSNSGISGSLSPSLFLHSNHYEDLRLPMHSPCVENVLPMEDASSSFDSGFESLGASSLLPDFNSLIIKESSNDILPELEFKIEDFENLDQYLHDKNYSSPTFENELLGARQTHKNSRDAFHLPEEFEDKMLEKITTGKRGNRVRHPQSWEFLVRLLMDPTSNPSLIRWEDKSNGIFRLIQKDEIARLWGKRSQKHKDEPLTYDNFARILRYHYKSKVLLPVSDKHLVYKLGDAVLNKLRSSETF